MLWNPFVQFVNVRIWLLLLFENKIQIFLDFWHYKNIIIWLLQYLSDETSFKPFLYSVCKGKTELGFFLWCSLKHFREFTGLGNQWELWEWVFFFNCCSLGMFCWVCGVVPAHWGPWCLEGVCELWDMKRAPLNRDIPVHVSQEGGFEAQVWSRMSFLSWRETMPRIKIP